MKRFAYSAKKKNSKLAVKCSMFCFFGFFLGFFKLNSDMLFDAKINNLHTLLLEILI